MQIEWHNIAEELWVKIETTLIASSKHAYSLCKHKNKIKIFLRLYDSFLLSITSTFKMSSCIKQYR